MRGRGFLTVLARSDFPSYESSFVGGKVTSTPSDNRGFRFAGFRSPGEVGKWGNGEVRQRENLKMIQPESAGRGDPMGETKQGQHNPPKRNLKKEALGV